MLDDLDLERIQDPYARQIIQHLLNLVETLAAENQALRAENQRLHTEIQHLKGEQGPPTVPPNRTPGPTKHSSEHQRHERRPRHKRTKRDTITIDRTHRCRIDPTTLPPDAVFKGYADVVVQDLVLRTDNVRFRKEIWYAPSTRQTYLAALPTGYNGAFGPNIKALAVALTADCHMSQPQLLRLFANGGVTVADGTLVQWLTHDLDPLHAEKDALYEAGLRSSPWQQIDDTATRVNGQNQHCHIVCNPLYTAYHTMPRKDRLTVLAVLRNHRSPTYRLNAVALGMLEQWGLAATHQRRLAPLARDAPMDEAAFRALLAAELPTLGPQQRTWVQEAAAIAAYRADNDWPVVRQLVGDEAAQWQLLTESFALCWVHAGRHYTKLEPCLAHHRRVLLRFRARFWRFYRALRTYQAAPTARRRAQLAGWFDRLFATQTGYAALDDRIAKTQANKTALLQVLAHPELPLHNNAAELGARQRVRKRDISFGPRTAAGAKAWDTLQTLAATAQKLGVSLYHYLHDRISGANQLPALADLITRHAKDMNLGASWADT